MTGPPGSLKAFHDGDPGLFRELVEHHSPGLLSLALAYWGDPDRAHETVQITWVQAYRNRRQLSAWGSLPAWLRTICRNVCRSEGRKVAARDFDPDALAHDAPRPEPTDAPAHRRALQRAVSEALDHLTPRQRDVVVLRMLEGRSTRECAQSLGIAEGTVKATLHHALHALDPLLRSWTDAPLP